MVFPPPSGLPIEIGEDDPDAQLNYMTYPEEWSGSESSWYLNVTFFNGEANLRTFLASQDASVAPWNFSIDESGHYKKWRQGPYVSGQRRVDKLLIVASGDDFFMQTCHRALVRFASFLDFFELFFHFFHSSPFFVLFSFFLMRSA